MPRGASRNGQPFFLVTGAEHLTAPRYREDFQPNVDASHHSAEQQRRDGVARLMHCGHVRVVQVRRPLITQQALSRLVGGDESRCPRLAAQGLKPLGPAIVSAPRGPNRGHHFFRKQPDLGERRRHVAVVKGDVEFGDAHTVVAP